MNSDKLKYNKYRSLDKTIQLSGAEAVIRCLLEESVENVFGYPGGAIMPVYDAYMIMKIK